MDSSVFTNTLLMLITGLLLVIVIQNGMAPRENSQVAMPQGHPTQTAGSGYQNPTVKPDAEQMASSMYFQALIGFPEGCDETRTLAACDSPAAQAVQQDILEFEQQGNGPRQVFDYIIDQYGMDALTEEAQRIRMSRP